MIDLRSDTVTLPSERMREAMANAEVGDDVFGEDATVNRLEALAAEKMGMEAGLYVSSGTMGNMIALLSHCGRGDEMIVGDQSHITLAEAGGASALGSIHPRPIPNQSDGTLDLDDVRAAIRPENKHYPRTKLICLENTQNRSNGIPIEPDYMQAIREVADQHEIAIHLDGARIFNAAVALEMPATELTKDVDSVTFCISKGLSAPVGSVLCGSEAFIYEARRARKMLGGGTRQAGFIAAAGVVALEEMVDRLVEDHVNARTLAEGLADLPGIDIDPTAFQTNIIYIGVNHDDMTPADLVGRLSEYGVLLLATSNTHMRAVTHYGIEAEDIEEALGGFRRVLC